MRLSEIGAFGAVRREVDLKAPSAAAATATTASSTSTTSSGGRTGSAVSVPMRLQPRPGMNVPLRVAPSLQPAKQPPAPPTAGGKRLDTGSRIQLNLDARRTQAGGSLNVPDATTTMTETPAPQPPKPPDSIQPQASGGTTASTGSGSAGATTVDMPITGGTATTPKTGTGVSSGGGGGGPGHTPLPSIDPVVGSVEAPQAHESPLPTVKSVQKAASTSTGASTDDKTVMYVLVALGGVAAAALLYKRLKP